MLPPEYNSSATLPFDTAKYLSSKGFSVDALVGYPKEYSNDINIPNTNIISNPNQTINVNIYQHQAKDSNKRCVYDSTHTPYTCYEEYKTCEDYTNNNIKTDKSGCENIKLLELYEQTVR